MPNKSTINFGTILKRSTCLNSTSQINESVHADELFDRAISAIQKSKDGTDYTINSSVNSFIEAISNKECADKYYWQPLKILSEMNKKGLVENANLFNHKYITRILPYNEDLDTVKADLDRFTISESQLEYINDSINKYKIADRIIGNYNSLSKRFNLEDVSLKYRVRGLKSFVESIANMVDTYNTKNYQKMNITLEEVDYILSKEGIKYDKGEMAKYVTEHYLMLSPYLSDNDINNYRKTLKENYILTESDLSVISYVFESPNNIDSIDSAINSFMLAKNKTPELLKETINCALRSTTNEDIIYNSSRLIDLTWYITKNAIFESENAVDSCIPLAVNYITDTILEQDRFNKEEADTIISNLNEVCNTIYADKFIDSEYAKLSINFLDKFNESSKELQEISQLLHNKSNIEAIQYLAQESNTILPLKEFKIFKFHNLIRAAFNLDKFLKVKERRLIDNGKNKISKFMKKTKNVLFGEATTENDMLQYIGDNGKALLTVRQYIYENDVDEDYPEFCKFLIEVCKDYNDILSSQNETCRAYYIVNSGIAEIKIGEQTQVDISDVDIFNSIDESVETYLELLSESSVNIEDDINIRDIYENIEMMKESSSFSLEQFELAMEAMSIIGVEKSKAELFANEFIDFNFDNAIISKNINESYGSLSKLESKVKSIIESWEPTEGVSLPDKVTAYNYLQSIFEYSFPDDNEDDDEDDEEEEEEKKPSKPEVKKPKVGGAVSKKEDTDKKDNDKKDVPDIDDVKIPKSSKSGKNKVSKALVNIKLGLQGLKTKYKDLNTKYKEACKNLDNAGRAFATATKNALVSDSREAIIKGQVVPSFSRCIKGAVILAGVAAFNLPAAVIGGLGALALSHKLTKTERLLLLDEIETELEVVDKELQLADSNNQINKYRELLKIKKNLQRQYQRIKYNIRVGKDILPGSAIGVPNSAD